MTKALGKEGSFAEGPSNSPRQRFFSKKILAISLPRASEQALGKGLIFFSKKPFLCRGPALGKEFLKKSWKFLCRGPGRRPSAKVFKKNKKIYLPRAGPRQKKFIKKLFLCRGSALGKETVNGADAWRLLFFAEGPTPSPSKNSPRGLCRGQPSAKPLPRVSGQALGKACASSSDRLVQL